MKIKLNTEVIMKNKLINETSPYLLQHAENPVNWYPWSEEAFQKAKEAFRLLKNSLKFFKLYLLI